MTTALATKAGQGEAIWWVGALAEIKATAEDTDGQLSIVEVTEGPDEEAPLHVHYREDEGFWILEGSATFYVGDEPPIEAGPGDFAGARGTSRTATTPDPMAAGCCSS